MLPSDGISVDRYETHIDKAQLMLGFAPTVALDDGLARMVASYPWHGA